MLLVGKMESMTNVSSTTMLCYVVGGLLASTYIANAIGATFYGNYCISVMSYNSPICAMVLVILTSAAALNYWIYYATITSLVLWGISQGRKLFTASS